MFRGQDDPVQERAPRISFQSGKRPDCFLEKTSSPSFVTSNTPPLLGMISSDFTCVE